MDMITEKWNGAQRELEEFRKQFMEAQNAPGYGNFLWGVLAAKFYESWGNEGVYAVLDELRKDGLPVETYKTLRDALEGRRPEG